MSYMICDDCAPAVAYGDMSGIYEDDAARVEANIELFGRVTPTGQDNTGGYWDCDACWGTCIGPHQVFETA